jgi:cytochrome c oxidase subunit 4
MSDVKNLDEFKKHLKVYIGVFVALLVLTAVTVGASYIHFGSKQANIVVALIIAIIKASLVAGWFMHLKTEKRSIYRVLYFTFFFFVALMFLTIWAFCDPVFIKS